MGKMNSIFGRNSDDGLMVTLSSICFSLCIIESVLLVCRVVNAAFSLLVLSFFYSLLFLFKSLLKILTLANS